MKTRPGLVARAASCGGNRVWRFRMVSLFGFRQLPFGRLQRLGFRLPGRRLSFRLLRLFSLLQPLGLPP